MDDLNRHQHAAIWAAIEKIAGMRGLTPSGLAKLAGLDATAFNRSKRIYRGSLRWPSAETIASVISVAGISWTEFGRLVDGA